MIYWLYCKVPTGLRRAFSMSFVCYISKSVLHFRANAIAQFTTRG